MESLDKQFLWKADEYAEEVKKLKRNIEVDRLTQKKKEKESLKTDDQLLNEAMRQNRRERNEAEKGKKIQTEKEANMKELRVSTRVMIKKKNDKQEKEKKLMDEGKNKYIEGLNEVKASFKDEFEKPTRDVTKETQISGSNLRAKKKTKKHKPMDKEISEDSMIQKEFVRHHNQQIEFLEWKLSMINLFKSLGMNEKEAEEELQKMIENHKKQNSESSMVDDPIPEEECHLWCEHDDCIESLETFETDEDLQGHILSEHPKINEMPRL